MSREAVAQRLPQQAAHAQSGVVQRKCDCGQVTGGGACSSCRTKKQKLQRRAVNDAASPAAPPIVHDVVRSAGQPIDAATRTSMGSAFARNFSHVRVGSAGPQAVPGTLRVGPADHPAERQADHMAAAVLRSPATQSPASASQGGFDFGGVRLHTDGQAAASAAAIGAKAYTIGNHIVFGAGQYRPETAEGRELLAHELAHVVQQNEGVVSPRLIQRQCGDLTHVDAAPAPSFNAFRPFQWTGECGAKDGDTCINGPVAMQNHQQWDPSGSGDYSRTVISQRHIKGTVNHATVPNCQIDHESFVTWVTVTEHDFPLQFSGDDFYVAVTFVFKEKQHGTGCNTTEKEGSEFRCQEVDSDSEVGASDAIGVIGTAASVASLILSRGAVRTPSP